MFNQRLIRTASDIMKLYQQLDSEVAVFASATGMNCPKGCGACCLSPHVETTVAEMLPLALRLFEKGEVEEVWERLQEGPSLCAQYEALPGQAVEQGRCRNYAQRPVLCRLFGYQGSRDKTGRPSYRGCQVLQSLEAGRIQRINAQLDSASLSIPMLAQAHERVLEIGGSMGERMLPINQALMRAIELVGLSHQLNQDPGSGMDDARCGA